MGELSRDAPAAHPRRILLLTTAYGVGGRQAPLSNELVDELARSGSSVTVVAIDWNATPGASPRHYLEDSGAQVVLLAPSSVRAFGRAVALATKWIGSSFVARREVARALPDASYDLMLAFSPAVAMAAVIRWAIPRSRHNILYITDFFPNHHVGLGLIPRPLAGVARALESGLIRLFDTVACMSPRGVRYLRENYRLDEGQATTTLTIWGDATPAPVARSAMRERYGLPEDAKIVLFGGQITEGRGIETILQVAAQSDDPNLIFLFLGSGSLEGLVKAAAARADANVRHLAAIPRDDYLTLASACDIGLVATVADVDVPTFPSKTVDYLRAGLPIVAAVERTTDYGDFVREHGFGVAVDADDLKGLLEAVRGVLDDAVALEAMRRAGAKALREIFDVRNAARRVLAMAETAGPDR